MSVDFRDFFSTAAFAPLVASLVNKPYEKGWYDTYEKLKTTHLYPAFSSFLLALKERGHLKPIPNSDGHFSHLLDTWNNFVLGTEDVGWEDIHICEMADKFTSVPLYRFATNPMLSFVDKYEEFAKTINSGTLDKMWVDRETCFNCGKTYQVEMNNWNIEFFTYTKEEGRVPMLPVPNECISELEIELSTGNLMIADWFRIEGFNEAVEPKEDITSINYSIGVLQTTRFYAETNNMIHVLSGNSSPSIAAKDDVLIVGQVTEDNHEDHNCVVGSVCTDLWWTTVIEEEKLVDLLTPSMGSEEAKKAVADYTCGWTKPTRVKVKPGKYFLYYTSHPGVFSELVVRENLPIKGFDDVHLVLSPTRLTLNKQTGDAKEQQVLCL